MASCKQLARRSKDRWPLWAALTVGAVVACAVSVQASAEAPVCPTPDQADGENSGLHKLVFFPNDAGLNAYYYLPKTMLGADGKYVNDGKLRPLVVALHGCGQTAAKFDNETGLRATADEFDFILLLPEQPIAAGAYIGSVIGEAQVMANMLTPANTGAGQFMGCFNHNSELAERGSGDPATIIQAIAAMTNCLTIDPQRIFVTGLSGGAAMSIVMAANYPDCFAGAASFAGLPFGCAAAAGYGFNVISHCMDVDSGTPMRGESERGPIARLGEKYSRPEVWGDFVRKNAERVGVPEGTSWPRMSIWQGSRDRVVAPANLKVLRMQWTNLHGPGVTAADPAREDLGPYTVRRVEYRKGNETVVETHEVMVTESSTAAGSGAGHIVPISGENCGCQEPFVADAGICASRAVAEFWGLKPNAVTPAAGADFCKPIRDARRDAGRECARTN